VPDGVHAALGRTRYWRLSGLRIIWRFHASSLRWQFASFGFIMVGYAIPGYAAAYANYMASNPQCFDVNQVQPGHTVCRANVSALTTLCEALGAFMCDESYVLQFCPVGLVENVQLIAPGIPAARFPAAFPWERTATSCL
jgi:hypothetical protein